MLSRSIGKAAGGLVLGLSVAAYAHAAPLFEPVTVISRASANSEPALGKLLATPSTATVQEVRVDAAATAQPQLEFELLGQRVQAVRSKVEALPDGGSIWYGQFRSPSDKLTAATSNGQDDPGNSLILVRSGDTVTGSIRKDGKLYRLRPLGNRHVLVEVDESRMPVDHPVDYNQLPKIPMGNNDRIGIAQASSGTPATIRVLVVATNAAVAAYGGNMQSLVQLAVAESNQGYVNSNVGITMQLAGYETTSYTESGSFDTDLARFRGTSDGYMDSIHTSRNNTAVDVGVLLINNTAYCGLASASARPRRRRSRRCTGIARPATTRSRMRSATCRARGMTSPPTRAHRPTPMATATAMSRPAAPAGARSWPTTAPAVARA